MAVLARGGLFFIHVRTHVHLAAYNRMNAALLRLFIKIDDAVHHAVVGDGARRLAQCLKPVHQPVDPARAVE
jgi:hypothetical protein